ncbi:MAG: RsbRD N-terminal domain-containing protein, partial [Pseudomonadota bacterium]
SDSIFASYPPETSQFLQKQKDRFSNPVGHSVAGGTGAIFEALLLGERTDNLLAALDGIIRIRSIQDFSSSQAVSFMFQLKTVIRQELAAQVSSDKDMVEQLLGFESRIDGVALLGFDIYMQCREKLYEISANEAKRRVGKLLERAGCLDTAACRDDAPESE